MNILLDSCVWGGAKQALEAAGYNTKWAGDLTHDPGDEVILKTAHEEKRILITLDKDFGTLAIVHDKPHSGIIRLVGYSALHHGPVSVKVLHKYGHELKNGAIVTVEKNRVRIRSARS